jgi:subtilisin family serine protease
MTVLLMLVGLVALLPAVSPSAAADETPTPPVEQPVVGPGVREAVAAAAAGRSGGPGPVLTVSLRDATPRSAPVPSLRAGARAAQAAVLDDLPVRGVEVLSDLQTVPAIVVRLTDSEALEVLASHPRVRQIDLGSGGTGDLAAAVPVVGGNLTHAEGITGEGVTVAVLDSGIDTNHPDLASDLRRQECFGFSTALLPPGDTGFCPNGTARQAGTGAAEDDAGHGTHVSGIITSDGTVSSEGMAPDAGIVAIKVLDNCSFGGCFYDFTLNVVAALDWVIANGATWDVQLLNASLGTGTSFSGNCDTSTSWTQAGAAAVNTLRTMGITLMSSAGNNSLQEMGAPACLSNVLSVGASDNSDVAAGFSNASTTTDVFAPGVNIVSDAIGGGTTSASGTSMASPMTAGCAALLYQADLVDTPAELEGRLETSDDTVTAFSRVYPRIDCAIDLCIPGITDVLATHTFCAEIDWLATEGITGGFPDGTYRPSAPVSRGSMAAFLYRMAGEPPVSLPGSPTFDDVPETHVFYEEIEWLAGTGITGGFSDDTYRPGTSVSRGSMAAFLYRAADSPAFTAPDTPSFDDVPVSHVFYDEIEWLAGTGITGGFPDDTYRPATSVSRGSMAAFLFRFDDAGFVV